jgi:hypothetical protein
MKIRIEHVCYFCSEKYSKMGRSRDAQSMQYIEECRKTVGYQFGPDWECNGIGNDEQKNALQTQYPNLHIGGFTCAFCAAVEANDWVSQGLISMSEVEEVAALLSGEMPKEVKMKTLLEMEAKVKMRAAGISKG